LISVVKDETYLLDPESVIVNPGAKVAFKVLGPDVASAQIGWETTGGTLTNTGILTAPATPGTYTVLAYVASDITRVVTASVTVAPSTPVASVTVSPGEIDLDMGGTTMFTAQVEGGTTGAVTWTCSAGTIDPNTGAYTAPNAFGTYTVKATSSEDGTSYGTATVSVKDTAGTDVTYTYDANGNMTSDGTRAFEWDAENRLVSVTITATGHRSEFGYDGFGRRVCIRELDLDTTQTLQVTSDKKYLWDGTEIAEERDTTGAIVLRRFYEQGFVDSDGTALFYTRDHLGSIRELTDGTQAIRARYDYDPWGRPTQLQGDRQAPFQYAGYFWHAPSGLDLTLYRAYDPNLGRWISRDPIEEDGGINLYGYVGNMPSVLIDPLGLVPPGMEIDPESERNLIPLEGGGGGGVGGGGGDFAPFEAPLENPIEPARSPSSKPVPDNIPPTCPPRTRGLPPSGVNPPGYNPNKWKTGPASRPSERNNGGQSNWDPNGGEWRYSPSDNWHNPHWDYNPHNSPNSPWQNIPIGGLPPRK
jgi:RHS repeat-associated protein